MNKIYWNTDTDVLVDINNVIDKSKIPTNCDIYLNFGITVVDCCKSHSVITDLIDVEDTEVIKCQYKREEEAEEYKGDIDLNSVAVDMNGNEINKDVQAVMYAATITGRILSKKIDDEK